MKKNKFLFNQTIIIVFLIFLLSCTLFGTTLKRVFASSCNIPATNYGTAKYTFSSLSDQKGQYRIWVRMAKTFDNKDSILVDYDGVSCFRVGDKNTLPKTWNDNEANWIGYNSGDLSKPNSISLSPGNHTITLIGIEPGVKVDRVLILDENSSCKPKGLGNNCAEAVNKAPQVDIISPVDRAEVSTNAVIISARVTDTDNNLQDVTIKDGANVLQTFKPSADSLYKYTWNTLNTTIGTHAISVVAKDTKTTTSSTVNVLVADGGKVSLGGIQDNGVWIGARSIKASSTGLNAIQKMSFEVTKPNGQLYTLVDAVAPFCFSKESQGDSCVAFDSVQNGWTDGNYAIRAVATYIRNGQTLSKESAVIKFNVANTSIINMPPSNPGIIAASNITKNSLDLAWGESADDGFVKEYKIYQNSKEITSTFGSSSINPAASRVTVDKLACGTSYSFKVRAYDNGTPQLFSNAYSDTLTTTTVKCDDIQQPTTPFDVKTTDISSDSITLSWSPATDNVKVKKYIIIRKNSNDVVNQFSIDADNTLFFKDTELLPNNKYIYTIIAEDEASNRSDQSEPVQALTKDITCKDSKAPSEPAGFRVTHRNTNGVEFAWEKTKDNDNCASGIARYKLYILSGEGQLVKDFSSTSNSASINTLRQNMEYEFFLTAVDGKNNESGKSPSNKAGLKVKTLKFGDSNDDNQVGLLDLAELLSRWRPPSDKYDEKYDVDGDNKINLYDLSELLVNWTR